MRISRRISAEIFRKFPQHGELHFPHEIDEKWSAGSALDRREKRDEGGLDAGSKFCDEDALGKARLGHRADPRSGAQNLARASSRLSDGLIVIAWNSVSGALGYVPPSRITMGPTAHAKVLQRKIFRKKKILW